MAALLTDEDMAYVKAWLELNPPELPFDSLVSVPSFGASSVTSLPASGNEVVYTDSLTAPTYAWHLKWFATASKWMFLGGSALEGTTTITIPIAGDYMVEIGGEALGVGATGNDIRQLTLTAGGITLYAAEGQGGGQNNPDYSSCFDRGHMVGLTAAEVLTPTVSGTAPPRQYIRATPIFLT